MWDALRCRCYRSRKGKDIEGYRKTEDINAQLRKDVKQSRSEVKMLLLGAGESGKSTILKQMKLIHEGGYNVQELRAFRAIVYNNVGQSIKMLVDASENLHVPLVEEENEANKLLIRELPDQTGQEHFSAPMVAAIKAVWADPGIQEVLKRAGRDFYLIDSAQYFLDNIERIGQSNYVPDDQDVLRCRVKTTGITETVFHINNATYRMFDVGGQRSERKKWIHCFENVTAIIFMVALSEYDQKLVEDETCNRMSEALGLFDSICNSRWFNKTSIILFLNKFDVFEEKIGEVPISDYFPDYEGGIDVEAGCEYFKRRFEQLNMSDTKKIYTHYTCATDTRQIRFVMQAVSDIITQESLHQADLL